MEICSNWSDPLCKKFGVIILVGFIYSFLLVLSVFNKKKTFYRQMSSFPITFTRNLLHNAFTLLSYNFQ